MLAALIVAGLATAIGLALIGKANLDAALGGNVQATANYAMTVVGNTPMAKAVPNDDGSNINLSSSDLTAWRATGVGITTDTNTWPSGDAVWDICRAIAHAEGYDTNHAALHLNNPGDLSPGDEHGYPTSGPAEFHDGSNIIHFATAAAGWNALYTKVWNIVNGNSKVYGQDWTVAQIAQEWAGNSVAWANGVAKGLGYSDPNMISFAGYVNV
jgi:hypothetical protein